jgi:hypothetical protein
VGASFRQDRLLLTHTRSRSSFKRLELRSFWSYFPAYTILLL